MQKNIEIIFKEVFWLCSFFCYAFKKALQLCKHIPEERYDISEIVDDFRSPGRYKFIYRGAGNYLRLQDKEFLSKKQYNAEYNRVNNNIKYYPSHPVKPPQHNQVYRFFYKLCFQPYKKYYHDKDQEEGKNRQPP